MKLDPIDIFSDALFGSFFSPFLRAGAYYLAIVFGAWLASTACGIEENLLGYGSGEIIEFDGYLFLHPLRMLLSSAMIFIVAGLIVSMFLETSFFLLLAVTILGASAFWLHDAEAGWIAWSICGALNLGILGTLVFANIFHRNRNARTVHELESETLRLAQLRRRAEEAPQDPTSDDPPDDRAA